VKWAVVIAVLLAATGVAAAQNSAPVAAPPAKPVKAEHASQRAARPLPVVIPQQFAPPQEAYASQPESAEAAAPATPSACQLRLAKIATFKPLGTIVGAGECGTTDAVLIDAVTLADQSKVTVMPAATMRCPMAEEIAHWVREDVAPSVKVFNAPLRGLDNFASYDCRGRNNVRAAAMSEHGRADALDVRDFKLGDGQSLGLTDVTVAKDWRESIKASVCARFSTVLGPGSDGYHEEHIHLDLAERHNGFKLCQWAVREPAPPAQVAAKDTTPANTASADDTTAASDDAAIPLDRVPLPRPRPVAQIERALSNRHDARPDARPGAEHRSSFDGSFAITAQ
jgi:hypothetical protein